MGTAPHRAVIITKSLFWTSLVPEAWIPRLGSCSGDELRSSLSPWLTQAEEVSGEVVSLRKTGPPSALSTSRVYSVPLIWGR